MAMIPQTMANTPPITAVGIEDINAANLLEQPKRTNHPPTARKTRRLATPVMEIIPALVE
ncbi:hypothetical protein D3C86_2217740 [compost metagenome]